MPYVLDALEHATARARVKMLQIKDDTFTTNKKRVLELCRGIRDRKLKFLWSCDTRVDVLNEELLYEMRQAGCQRLSLGVETGSPTILKNIDKKITIDEIVAAAEMAKKYGVHVRFYMMLGNRGETVQTFRETLDFLARAKPHTVHLLVPLGVPGHARLSRCRESRLARSRALLHRRLSGAEGAVRRLRRDDGAAQ